VLALSTSDDWAFDLLFDDGGGFETYSNTATDARSFMVALEAWLNDAGRPWSGVITSAVTWARGADGHGWVTLTFTGDQFECVADATARLRTGLDDTGAPVSAWTSTLRGMSGSWAPPPDGLLAVSGVRAWSADRGDANAAGAVLPWTPGTAGMAPRVTAIARTADVAVLARILATATNPRRAYIYQQHTATWWRFSLDDVTREAVGTTLYRVAIEALGEAI